MKQKISPWRRGSKNLRNLEESSVAFFAGAGLSSPVFMSQATTNTTQKNQFARLNMKVDIVIIRIQITFVIRNFA